MMICESGPNGWSPDRSFQFVGESSTDETCLNDLLLVGIFKFVVRNNEGQRDSAPLIDGVGRNLGDAVTGKIDSRSLINSRRIRALLEGPIVAPSESDNPLGPLASGFEFRQELTRLGQGLGAYIDLFRWRKISWAKAVGVRKRVGTHLSSPFMPVVLYC